MFPRLVSVTAALLLTTAVVSADQARQRWPGSAGQGSSGQGNDGGSARQGNGGGDSNQGSGERTQPRTAEPRGERARESAPPARAAAPVRETPRREPPPRREAVPPPASTPETPPPAAAPARPQGAPQRAGEGDSGVRTAQPRQRWPGPVSSAGVAVPRESRPPVSRPDGWNDGYRSYPRVYNNYYYYPRRYYPYGYGSFGLGYFYYDPYTWYPYDNYNYRFQGYGYGYPTGEIRLQVRPRQAEVYVDGYYAGQVDEFDGFVQALRLEEGPYTIELVAPGYEPLQFNVRIQPGRKITYRGDMRLLRP
jgi:hypothetical protein